MEIVLDPASIAVIIGVAAMGGGGLLALGKLIEKVNQLEKRLDKLDSSKTDEEK